MKGRENEERNDISSTYKPLMMAVFENSIDSLKKFDPIKTEGEKYFQALDSWRWLERDDAGDHPFSFLNICEFLGYEAENIRKMTYDILRNNDSLDFFLSNRIDKSQVA